MGAEELIQKVARPLLSFLFEAIPVVISISQHIYKVYKELPTNVLYLLIGTVMCFFGGFYPTVFAALQVSLDFECLCFGIMFMFYDLWCFYCSYGTSNIRRYTVHYPTTKIRTITTIYITGSRTRRTRHSTESPLGSLPGSHGYCARE